MHGERSAQGIERSARVVARIRQSEDALRLLGAAEGPKPVGRPPSLYVPLNTLEDVRTFVASVLAEDSGGTI